MYIELDKVGDRLKDARKAIKLTREEMAERINVSIATIAKLETGNFLSVRIANLLDFCTACDVTPDYILYGYDTKIELGKAEKSDQDLIKKYNRLSVKDRAYIEDIIDSLTLYRKYQETEKGKK